MAHDPTLSWSYPPRQHGRVCASLGLDFANALNMHMRCAAEKDASEFTKGFRGECLHFVGFRGDEYTSAVRIFGRPDFFHRYWDHRAIGDIAPGDTVVFAKGTDRDTPNPYAFNDSERF